MGATRSRSAVRARKRVRGALRSQQPDEEWNEEAQRARVLEEKIAAQAGKPDASWPDCAAWRPKSMFDLYYKLVRVVAKEEWYHFSEALRRPLPVTFRFTADAPDAFRAEGERVLRAWEARGLGTRRLGLVDGWQLHADKHELRAAVDANAGAVRDWLIRGTDAGYVVRQEVASMLPGVLVGVTPGSRVLDMCAAPGSKTTQIVEALNGEGVVVANDASPLRSYTLVKRTASLGVRAAGLVVACHAAQRMPAPADGRGYDRIICDVPCTGDGTVRKHPEVFGRWEVALALRQHPLQLAIATRGAALLAVGGVMCYSTCSLNPARARRPCCRCFSQWCDAPCACCRCRGRGSHGVHVADRERGGSRRAAAHIRRGHARARRDLGRSPPRPHTSRRPAHVARAPPRPVA